MRKALSGIVSKSALSLKSVAILALAVGMVTAGAASTVAAKYAAIVVDAKTGKTLYSQDANGRRYPASLTKMMTLYLTFEALSRGKINKESLVSFSANAAAEPPTKLGVKAGGAVTVETAILSLVTKSANDSATALGEMLGGSEDNFARMMTAKARSLGMNGTVFRNANGLPNPGQFTTAHDMAVLGIALKEHFPQYYGYFSTRSFAYGRQRIANHNHLLGRIKGVDGIKTGYTRISGFNLVSSVSDGNRRLVAVVMGGTSGGARDRQMVELINTYMPQATLRGNGPLVARADGGNPIKALANVLKPKRTDAEAKQEAVAEAVDGVEEAAPPRKKAVIAKAPAPVAAAAAAAKSAKQAAAAPAMEAYAEPEKVDPVKTASVSSGWAVQVASSPKRAEAQAMLDKTAKQAGSLVSDASGFTVAFDNGGVTYYRARFGGYGSKNAAWSACNSLKKKKIACYAVQQ